MTCGEDGHHHAAERIGKWRGTVGMGTVGYGVR